MLETQAALMGGSGGGPQIPQTSPHLQAQLEFLNNQRIQQLESLRPTKADLWANAAFLLGPGTAEEKLGNMFRGISETYRTGKAAYGEALNNVTEALYNQHRDFLDRQQRTQAATAENRNRREVAAMQIAGERSLYEDFGKGQSATSFGNTSKEHLIKDVYREALLNALKNRDLEAIEEIEIEAAKAGITLQELLAPGAAFDVRQPAE